MMPEPEIDFDKFAMLSRMFQMELIRVVEIMTARYQEEETPEFLLNCLESGSMNFLCNLLTGSVDLTKIEPQKTLALNCWIFRETMKKHLDITTGRGGVLNDAMMEKIYRLDDEYENAAGKFDN